MPNFSDDLSDTEIAAILSHVRSSWGNHAAPIPPATVAAVRGEGKAPVDAASPVLPYH